MPIRLLAVLGALGLCASQYFIWVYAPLETSMGLVQKIFYYHLPMSWWALISFFVVFASSILYILRRDDRYDLWAGAAAEVGVLFAGLALVTGAIWGKSAWNVWWTWDPRLTTTIVMWFVYAAYLVLRGSDLGGSRRPLVCAVLGVVAFIDVPLVFYSARLWRSIHPAIIGAKGGGMEPEMWHAMIVSLISFGFVWAALLLLRRALMRDSRRAEALVALEAWD